MNKTLTIVLISIVAIVAAGYLMMMGAGKPISADLTLVANGRPAIVLAYENFSPQGGAALNQLRKVRDEFDARMEFVIADLGTPQGRNFANRHELVDGLAVFMSETGEVIKVIPIPVDDQALRMLLNTLLDHTAKS